MDIKDLKGSKKTQASKIKFINAMIQTDSSPSLAEKVEGTVTRHSHNKWMQEDKVYKYFINDIDDIIKDVVNTAAMTEIRNGNTAIILQAIKQKKVWGEDKSINVNLFFDSDLGIG